MMSSIHILPKTLSNQIAAGEVIERPFSVIKELVENSLDAQASHITVQVRKGGKELIEVTDNGTGMSSADAELSLHRFATSKIQTEEDLFNIHSFGFRGEALPSIASVSIFTLQTRPQDSSQGTEIRVKGGTQEWIKSVGMNTGTRVVVEHLFFNIPARKKYLKSDTTELSHIAEYLTQIALIHPAVAFTLTHNDKKVFQLPPRDSLQARIQDLFGDNVQEEILPLETGGSPLELSGFISHPRYSRPTGKYEFLFVNRRPVKNQMIHKAVLEGYERTMERGSFPFFVLNLEIDPTKVDVNVHPRKLEVRFEDAHRIFSFFKHAVEQSLQAGFLHSEEGRNESSASAPLSFASQNTSAYPVYEQKKYSSLRSIESVKSPRSPYAVSQTYPHTQTTPAFFDLPSSVSHPQHASYFKKIIGQIHHCYILFETEKGFGVADQHAAHEIILYHKIKDAHARKKIAVQRLLAPVSIDIPAGRVPLWERSQELLSSLGFETSLIGKQTLLLSAVPNELTKADLAKALLDVLDELEEYAQRSPEELKEKIYATMACRAAVKFGDTLKPEEQWNLLHELEQLQKGYSCPHGRPVLKEFSLQEMLKWFKR